MSHVRKLKTRDKEALEKIQIVDHLIEDSNMFLAKNDDNGLVVSADFFSGIDFMNLTEVNLSSDLATCTQCKKEKKYITSLRALNTYCYICSLVCLKQFLDDYSQYMVRNLRIGNNFSANRCLYCRRQVTENCVLAMLQRFCNEDCLLRYQQRNYERCFLCHELVASNMMGRFTFYRNQKIYQLCSPECQEKFKQFKSCHFCSKSLNQTEMLTFIIAKSKKNFCNEECYTKFKVFLENTDITKRNCAVCKLIDIKGHYIEVEMKLYKLFFCSRICFYVFFEMNSMISGKVALPYFICMYCRRLFLRNNDVVIAYNGKCQAFQFCSELCKWFLLYSQSKDSYDQCLTCAAKKHHYDLIHYRHQNETQTYCSIHCHNTKKLNTKTPTVTHLKLPIKNVLKQQQKVAKLQTTEKPTNTNAPSSTSVANTTIPKPVDQQLLNNSLTKSPNIQTLTTTTSAHLVQTNTTNVISSNQPKMILRTTTPNLTINSKVLTISPQTKTYQAIRSCTVQKNIPTISIPTKNDLSKKNINVSTKEIGVQTECDGSPAKCGCIHKGIQTVIETRDVECQASIVDNKDQSIENCFHDYSRKNKWSEIDV